MDKIVVGMVFVIVVHCVEVSVTKSFVFVAVTVTMLASGALFSKPPANLAALSSTNSCLAAASAAAPRLNFAEFVRWKMVLRMVISILAIGSGTRFGVGEAQEAWASTVVWVT